MRKVYFLVVVLIGLGILASEGFSTQNEEKQNVRETQNLQTASFVPVDFGSGMMMAPTAVDTLNWKLLGMIKFVKKPDKEYGEVMYPVISPLLKQKNKKRIAMTGFIVPIDNVSYALSKNVFASCFFCGAAGPETIMGIKFRGATPKLKTDQYVTLEGNFRVNETDVEDWIYHIEDAIIVKGK
jgi:hypothetical protein